MHTPPTTPVVTYHLATRPSRNPTYTPAFRLDGTRTPQAVQRDRDRQQERKAKQEVRRG